jgi:hypothetical protein
MRGLTVGVLTGVVASTTAHAQISPGPLSAAHQKLEGVKNCLKCHELGAGPKAEKCLDCHKAIAGRLADRQGFHSVVVNEEKKMCFECHNEHAGTDFALIHWPEGMRDFDHHKTGYDLLGKHRGLECDACHKPGNVSKAFAGKYEDVNSKKTFLGISRACLGCHEDEHRGQLATTCESCHGYDGWRPAPGFDHNRTAFALTGRHRDVACGKCHPGIQAKGRDADHPLVRYTGINAANCASCHKDVHGGQLGAECSSCHRTDGWSAVTTANFDHSKTRFPLRGRHRNVECTRCHTGASKVVRRDYGQCQDCHADVHRGQFMGQVASSPSKGRCESCHNESGFVPATFTVADHARTRFPLEGAHLALPCTSCHVAVKDNAGTYRRYRATDISCASCHGTKNVTKAR